MAKEEIVLIGGGGHCKSVIDVIETEDKFCIAGVIDTKEKLGHIISGYEFIGTDDDLINLVKEYQYFLITVGQIKNSRIRFYLYEKLKKLKVTLPVIVSPKAYIARTSTIDEGTVVMHNSFVNAAVKVGVNSIINTSAIIEHDSLVGDHSHISTGAVINGDCRVGNHCFIGSNAVVLNGITIQDNVIVGAGSVVRTNLEENKIFFGNPAKQKI